MPQHASSQRITPIRLAVSMVIVAAWALPSAGGAAEPLRVLCYNIHYGQGTDGKYDIDRLANVILKSQPDLVALQEVDVGVKRSGRVHQAQLLGKRTGMAVRYGPTQQYQGGLYGNAVLSKLPILDVQIHPLPYSESNAERTTYPRGAVAVVVRTADGKNVRFISTHFQHNVAEDRIAEAKAINRLFAKPTDKTPTILAGDMNAKPDSEPIATLLKAWTHAAHPKTLAPTAPSIKPHSRIDYIFYRSDSAWRVSESSVIDEAIASDHRPVFAVLELVQP